MPFTLGALAAAVGGRVHGDPERQVDGIAPLQAATPSQLSFLAHPRYRRHLAGCRAGALVVAPGREEGLAAFDLLVHPEPYRAVARLIAVFHPESPPPPGVHPSAWVDPGARVHPSASVGAGAVVEAGAEVGEGTRLDARSVVAEGVRVGRDCRVGAGAVLTGRSWLGDRVRVGEGAVIGSAGFGYVPGDPMPEPIPQVGRVVLEDDVEVGANSTVDRATLGETRLRAGTKVDNLVQVGHNVVLGRGALVAAQVGIAGSTRVGDGVMIGGQAGLIGHLEVGDGARIGAGAGVAADVPPGAVVSGGPAFDHAAWRRAMTLLPRLPELLARVRRLESRGGVPGAAASPGPRTEDEGP